VLARGAQRLRERKAAPESVAVGILVPEDQNLFVGVDELFDLVVKMPRLLGGRSGYESTSSCGRTSFSSSLMWTAYSIDPSSSKRSSGENFRF